MGSRGAAQAVGACADGPAQWFERTDLSAASVWEMAIKRSLGKLETDIPLGDLVAQGREKIQLRLLDITAAHAVAVEALPFHHKDPFDRLLIAQALSEELTIVGADRRFDPYGVKRLW